MAAGKKKSGGFFRAVLLLALGFTAGMGAAAAVAVYINELHLPFITPPTRQPTAAPVSPESGREAVEFHQILRQQKPSQLKTESAESAPPARRFVFYLQVGVFKDGGNAENIRGQLALAGRKASVRTGQAADGNPLYRVWLGPYKDEETAENVRAQLALDGYSNVSLLKTAE